MFTSLTRLLSLSIFIFLAQTSFWISPSVLAEERQIFTTADIIKKKFATEEDRSWTTVGGEIIHSFDMSAFFYQKRDFRPAWTGSDGSFSQAGGLIGAIEEAYKGELIPEYYHIKAINALLLDQVPKGQGNSQPDPMALADLDVLLTDSFLLLSCHLSDGCADPGMRRTEWIARNGKTDVIALLENSLSKNHVKEALGSLNPKEKLNTKLRQALPHYRQLAARNEAWPPISPEKPSINMGIRDGRIPAIRHRLAILEDLPIEGNTGSDLYDGKLARAISAFQQRHGLESDGVIGTKTITAMNVSPEKRARQIEINLERLRLRFRNPGHQYLLVNIANFSLDVVENDAVVMNMRVVVGKPFWDTPVFSGRMRYLVLNPSWNIPRNIAVGEILPKVLKDSQYLLKNDIRVLQSGGVIEEKELQSLEWTRLSTDYFPYQLRQEPGPRNPLGSIKFMFPNQFDVYLHDSPQKGLFQRNVRAFSHGCIRIEKPVDLAVYLMRDSQKWTREAILSAIAEGTEQIINLPQSVPVHLLYLTAWVDDSNAMQFRDDIYGRDNLLDEPQQLTRPVNSAAGP